MGSNSGSNSGGNTGPANRYKTPAKKAADKVVDFVKGGGITGAVIRGIKKGAAESKAKKEANVEMGLGTDRMSNYSTSQNDNGNVGAATSSGMVVQAPTVTSPTTAEVSQVAPEVTSEEARASANELILKKRKGRGRSLTILTSAQGVQDNKGLTLGKPSLLG